MYATILLSLALSVSAPESRAAGIEGEWVVVAVIDSGKAERVADGSRLTVTADGRFLIKDGQSGVVSEMRFTVDPKPAPAHIDIREPDEKEPAPGIYKVDRELLTVCVSFGSDRPRAFASPADSSVLLMTFKRAK